MAKISYVSWEAAEKVDAPALVEAYEKDLRKLQLKVLNHDAHRIYADHQRRGDAPQYPRQLHPVACAAPGDAPADGSPC